MLHMFGELASSGLASGGGRRHSLRRGSEVGERLEHTIALTSHSSTPSAHEGGGDGGGGVHTSFLSLHVIWPWITEVPCDPRHQSSPSIVTFDTSH
ncbi:hypothetical protein RRG08_011830 [Elysia crispata]|uniref:Uncharacterized protein n=1 Tax=Elysia crispata TaxID=231223 RepID=A0AAE1A685_9GAST|nr:hypothetical protein RRG08_011830 [Elysia crispata]